MSLTTSAKRALALAAQCPACPSGPGEPCPDDGTPGWWDGIHDSRQDSAVPEVPEGAPSSEGSEAMTDSTALDARLAVIRDRTSKILAEASPSPDMMRASEAVHHALAVLLATHEPMPYYAEAYGCGHAEPEVSTDEWDQWEKDHPFGTGDIGRICKLTQTDSFCPACTDLAYDDEPVGDDYVSAAACIVRPPFERTLAGAGQ